MIDLRHTCGACSTKFTITYNEMHTEADPTHCPFCGEYLILTEDDFDDRELHDDEDDDPL